MRRLKITPTPRQQTMPQRARSASLAFPDQPTSAPRLSTILTQMRIACGRYLSYLGRVIGVLQRRRAFEENNPANRSRWRSGAKLMTAANSGTKVGLTILAAVAVSFAAYQ